MSDAAGALGIYEVNSLPREQVYPPCGALGCVLGGELNQRKNRIGWQFILLILFWQDYSFPD